MNYLSGLKAFIDAWDDPFVEASETDRVLKSPQGNLNSEGTSECYGSPALTKYHRWFKKSIEPGVRDLTIALIQKFNCITYSSCQGHFSTADSVMRQRYVGMVPRTDTEYQALSEKLHKLANLTNSQLKNHSVQVVIYENTLESEGLVWRCLNLFFVSQFEDEARYFQEIEPVYQTVLRVLNEAF
jgi:hypothetical protein